MKARKKLNIAMGVGITISVASSLWWGVVYYFVSKGNEESMWSSLNCLYSLSQECNFLRAMGWLRGINPYEPLLFWVGIGIVVTAWWVKRSLSLGDAE